MNHGQALVSLSHPSTVSPQQILLSGRWGGWHFDVAFRGAMKAAGAAFVSHMDTVFAAHQAYAADQGAHPPRDEDVLFQAQVSGAWMNVSYPSNPQRNHQRLIADGIAYLNTKGRSVAFGTMAVPCCEPA